MVRGVGSGMKAMGFRKWVSFEVCWGRMGKWDRVQKMRSIRICKDILGLIRIKWDY